MKWLSIILWGLWAATAQAEELFVKLPYCYGVDEGLIKALKSGKTTFKLPEGIRVKDGNVEVLFHKSVDGKFVEEWTNVEKKRMLFGICFRDDIAHETISECYFVRKEIYDQVKPYLPHYHKGRLEFFLKPDVDAQKAERDNPDHWYTFVWDAEDQIWRYPTHLYPVDLKKDETALSIHLAEAKVRPEDKTGVILEMLQRQEQREREWRLAEREKRKAKK